MFIGIFTRTDWKQSKRHAKRPCVYRDAGHGLAEVMPCSTNTQASGTFIDIPFRKDVGLRRETHLLLEESHRQMIPLIWIEKVGECPADITDQILSWEREHTV